LEIRGGVGWTARQVERIAREIYGQNPDWAVFYRDVLGLDGIVRRAFDTSETLAEFERTESYEEILKLLTQLRARPPLPPDKQEPSRVITVRLPRAVHEALREEAYERHTSMNKLCVSKLLQFIDKELVPTDGYKLPPQAERPEEEAQQERDAVDL
jgi:predicted HicB family RNase H-like nuclease